MSPPFICQSVWALHRGSKIRLLYPDTLEWRLLTVLCCLNSRGRDAHITFEEDAALELICRADGDAHWRRTTHLDAVVLDGSESAKPLVPERLEEGAKVRVRDGTVSRVLTVSGVFHAPGRDARIEFQEEDDFLIVCRSGDPQQLMGQRQYGISCYRFLDVVADDAPPEPYGETIVPGLHAEPARCLEDEPSHAFPPGGFKAYDRLQ